MLQPSSLKYLNSLQKNNNKHWFEENRESYEEVKADFFSLVEKIIPAIAAFDPSIADQLARNCTFRINRDVRFSKNKTPYKNHLAAYFNKAGKKGIGAGYYLHIEPGKSFAAAGIWSPEPASLARIRQEIDYNFDDWNKILSHSRLKKKFGSLEETDILLRAPKGYTENNPAMKFLRLKSFILKTSLTDAAITNKQILKDVVEIFRAAYPMVSFLNRATE